VTLTNVRADRVKAVRALAGRSARLKHQQYLVEGPQGVREAVFHAEGSVRDLYVTEDAHARYPEIVCQARSAREAGSGLRVHGCSDEVVRAMSADCQGVLAVMRMEENSLSMTLGSAANPRLVAIVSNVRDPGNAGTVIRVADAAGADAVILTGDSVDVYNPKTVRSTAGSLFHLPVVSHPSLVEVCDMTRSAGATILAADGHADATLDTLLDDRTLLAGPTAWLFGNEAWGLTEEDRALADHCVSIPLRGKAESLNLATAASVCLFASAYAQMRG
jgi:TrmH family RNA methyltransferase